MNLLGGGQMKLRQKIAFIHFVKILKISNNDQKHVSNHLAKNQVLKGLLIVI